jgi:uncharacterized protein with HEPN domain
MRPDARAYLWDAVQAAEAVQAFSRGQTYDSFIEDHMVRSAVERQLQIVGEALAQLAKIDPESAAKLPDLPRIIAFRNILVHGYAGNRLRDGLASYRGEIARASGEFDGAS